MYKQQKSLRVTSLVTILTNMRKQLYPAIIALFALLSFSGCSRIQDPTVLKSGGSSQSELGFSSGELLPSEIPEDWSNPDSLTERGSEEGISDGRYNGRNMMIGILDPVYYGFDSSAIAAAERVKLQEAADYLINNPARGLLVEGRCDWYGTSEYNLALGDRRAASARDYLITLGVEPGRLETLSKGSLDAVSGLSKIESAVDRRAELIVLE
jgi:peptidoglycan-associated lipoprotein|tara:strand:+ start:124 stop:759 length:636 start_codon:yes stop_codon:yes gene_type:complete